jgi:hypothetical protein
MVEPTGPEQLVGGQKLPIGCGYGHFSTGDFQGGSSL